MEVNAKKVPSGETATFTGTLGTKAQKNLKSWTNGDNIVCLSRYATKPEADGSWGRPFGGFGREEVPFETDRDGRTDRKRDNDSREAEQLSADFLVSSPRGLRRRLGWRALATCRSRRSRGRTGRCRRPARRSHRR